MTLDRLSALPAGIFLQQQQQQGRWLAFRSCLLQQAGTQGQQGQLQQAGTAGQGQAGTEGEGQQHAPTLLQLGAQSEGEAGEPGPGSSSARSQGRLVDGQGERLLGSHDNGSSSRSDAHSSSSSSAEETTVQVSSAGSESHQLQHTSVFHFELIMLVLLGCSLPVVFWRKIRIRHL